MFGITAGIAWLLFGDAFIVVIGALAAASALMVGRVAPRVLFRLYRATLLDPLRSPQLYEIVGRLAQRAGLDYCPQLYYIPSQAKNAFAVGTGRQAAIGVTDGILRQFPVHEVAAILAHEVAHIRNRDTVVMGMADVLSRFTGILANVGFFLLFLNLPAILLGSALVPWIAVWLLVLAPGACALLQLGLSRTREFDADAEAVRLTGDPGSLASALRRLNLGQGSFFERMFIRYKDVSEPSLLRTHPPLEERIRRIYELEQRPTIHQIQDWIWGPYLPEGREL